MQTDTARGTILLAHGSRDPLWRKPIEAVASQIREIAPEVQVRCAYLELSTPDLPTSAAELAVLGVTAITVVPLFLGVGRHAREDLPRLMVTLQASHPQVVFSLRPAIGEEAQIIELMARIALS
ncbi:sirohydrochlorin chelatase [Rhodoferax sp. UBA5149]|uniref:sirohydrochlorin chelatase n=1 Tax=Rhodoferax sp. UBA5149 TaxID=1947379 RepID=UPI0025DD4C7F|nr:CbiX/SirB N-terminal domain-containing protein [Rhodoferax sp. UBA5149]